MPACERIPQEKFDDAEARIYTAQCLQHLQSSKAFKDYHRHQRYTERVYLTWFLGPMGLVVILYLHTVLIGTANNSISFVDSLNEVTSPLSDYLPYLTAALVLFIVPALVVACFSGFFTQPTLSDSTRTFFLFTVTHILIVSSGNEMLHRPPLLNTSPSTLPLWCSGAWTDAIRVTWVRLAPLQGLITAGWLVSAWQRSFWRRAWHPPMPYFTVPLATGLFALFSSRFLSLLLPQLLSQEGGLESQLWNVGDPAQMAAAWGAVAREVLSVQWVELRSLCSGNLPYELHNTESCLSLYAAFLLLALVYASFFVVGPVVDMLLEGALELLPVHPTTWLLTLLSSMAGAVYFLKSEGETSFACAGIFVAVTLALLYNGFHA